MKCPARENGKGVGGGSGCACVHVRVCMSEAGSEWPWKCWLALFLRFLSKGQQNQICVLKSRFWKKCPFGRVARSLWLLCPDWSLEGGLGSEVHHTARC